MAEVSSPSIDQTGGAAGQVPELPREEILKQIFGDIGELIDDFTCAVESTVLLHGRMYITNRFICFYSNLFGLEKKIRIPYSHIKSITKENTAMVIPNAICISTDKRDYLFRSFWDREDCYRILNAFLDKFKYGGTRESVRLRTNTVETVASDVSALSAATGAAPIIATAVPITDTKSQRRGSAVADGSDDVYDAESGFKSEKLSNGVVTDQVAEFQQELAKGRLKIPVISGTMDISLKDFFNLFISETAPYSYKRYHESVKDSNLSVSAWEELSSSLGFGRDLKFFKPVNLPGLASTRGVKIQRYRKFGEHGIILYSSTRLEDVPAADTFSVDDVLAVNKITETSINVEITFQVSFLKSTYMKYIIERSTNSEMSKWLETFFNHLKRTTELFKEGKITMQNQPNDSPAPSEAAKESPVAEIVVEKQPELPTQATPFSSINVVLLLIVIVLVVVVAINYLKWQASLSKLNALQTQVDRMENILNLLLSKLDAQGGAQV